MSHSARNKVRNLVATQKPIRKARHTIIVVFDEDTVPVPARVLQWEDAARTSSRRVHRVEFAEPGWGGDGGVYIVDLELECRGANRHDFTKFVQRYLPEASRFYITE